jgi:release factor glutamine methyltransferase
MQLVNEVLCQAHQAETILNLKHEFDSLRFLGVQHPEKDYEAFCKITFARSISQQDLQTLSASDLRKLNDFFSRRSKREPLERIINKAFFYDHEFLITDNVFKPAHETEITVDHGLRLLKDISSPRILDCGTGSGNIIISMLINRPDATGVGIDISEDIISIASQNAQRSAVKERVSFCLSDWGNELDEKFDLIISNPPRIPTKLIPELVREVSNYDPAIALDGGDLGIDFYKRSARLLQLVGKDGAVCVLQVGNVILKQAVKAVLSEGYEDVRIGIDYRRSPNCLIFSKSDYQDSYKTKRLWSSFLRRSNDRL